MRPKEEFRRKALSFDESLLLLHYTIIFFSKILQLKFFSKEGDKNKEQSECLVHLKKISPWGISNLLNSVNSLNIPCLILKNITLRKAAVISSSPLAP